MPNPAEPEPQTPPEPKIGVDQWVEQYSGRRVRRNRFAELIDELRGRLPVWFWLIIMVLVGLLLPLLTNNTFAIRIAGNVALLATLALGLNVVVGYAGLLDLGFVAFYGIGAYTYAFLSSDFTGIHLPTPVALLICVLVATLFGFLIGLPSLRLDRRLSGNRHTRLRLGLRAANDQSDARSAAGANRDGEPDGRT